MISNVQVPTERAIKISLVDGQIPWLPASTLASTLHERQVTENAFPFSDLRVNSIQWLSLDLRFAICVLRLTSCHALASQVPILYGKLQIGNRKSTNARSR